MVTSPIDLSGRGYEMLSCPLQLRVDQMIKFPLDAVFFALSNLTSCLMYDANVTTYI